MELTPYHSQYFAYELTRRRPSDQLEKLSQCFFNATVDLNPHQIEAALFAFRSPLSRGALLADEVGLGKTIEAGLIISQLWAERRRRILVLVPAALRKQWNRELLEKFFIESVILESSSFNASQKEHPGNPFEQQNKIVLCSYQFARRKEDEIRRVAWDLVVLDEAHRLRNVYKKNAKISRSIQQAISGRPKVLLTATPLQNSLMELYGLTSFLDEHLFGGEASFRTRFTRKPSEIGDEQFLELRQRLAPVCQRTLRRQVLEYIRYTNRVSMTQDFTPTDQEQRLYEMVSEYLQRPHAFAIPTSQRALLTLVLRKILASSSFAISDTLGTLIQRLLDKHKALGGTEEALNEALAQDFEGLEEVQEEWAGYEEEQDQALGENGGLSAEETEEAKLEAIRQEVGELRQYQNLAQAITRNAKGDALLKALSIGLQKAQSLGALPKALVFTESRRTQQYLRDLLEANGYKGQVVTLSGTQGDPESRRIYREWHQRHEGEDTITGSATADMRSALVEEFQNRASIMIATETGAEGINLQFCSLVVNYDLPWNPQRIEQRIGRCHRYGQRHDVVVINFLNRRNAADLRVLQLLQEKLRLFDGVFGSSDEVLGALESGVDFERRVHEIYQTCRTPEEINQSFDALQRELEEQITACLQDTQTKLLEHFDEDVQARLRLNMQRTEEQITRFEEWLWRLSSFELADYAHFATDGYAFDLRAAPAPLSALEAPIGRYRLVTQKDGTDHHHYRIGHPLAEFALEKAKARELPACEVIFRYDRSQGKVSLLEPHIGRSGWLWLRLLTLQALERQEYLIFAGTRDDGEVLDPETCSKFFSVNGVLGSPCKPDVEGKDRMEGFLSEEAARIFNNSAERNRSYFEAEMDKLEGWAEDLKDELERELKELDREIKVTKREAKQVLDLDAKLALHRKAKDMEKRRMEKRRSLFKAQDEVDQRKDTLLAEAEARLKQRAESRDLFKIRWQLV